MKEIFHCRRMFGIRKSPGYLYRLLDVLPKQTTYEITAFQVKVLHSTMIS